VIDLRSMEQAGRLQGDSKLVRIQQKRLRSEPPLEAANEIVGQPLGSARRRGAAPPGRTPAVAVNLLMGWWPGTELNRRHADFQG